MRGLNVVIARVNGFCDRLNSGLTAVAIVLAVAVLSMAAVRAGQIAEGSDTDYSSDNSAPEMTWLAD